MNVRKTALSLLRDAEAGDKYIALTLDGYLSANPCDARDRALLSALVYGTVERRVTLDYYIDALAADPKKVGARLRQILRPLGRFLWVALVPKTSAAQPGTLYEGHNYASLSTASDAVLLMT